jgi:putative protein kinase ArgK-like GTPase of G3E family
MPGAERLIVDLEEAVHIRHFGRDAGPAKGAWLPRVVSCSAQLVDKGGGGVDGVVRAIDAHREHVRARGLSEARREKRLQQVRRAVEEKLEERLWGAGGLGENARTLLDSGRAPYDVVEAILASILPGGSRSSAGEGSKAIPDKRGAKSA